MNDLTHLSLFTGIGGIDLAAEQAGFTTAGQVEQNPYALRVLRKRFGRRTPRWTDIKNLTADDFVRRTGIDSPTLISGGFPCQPFSCAGKRRGKEDDRYLWPEMFRIVRELRPAWVLGENVAGIVNMELENCCTDLESEGYTVRAFLIPACSIGTLHRRNRLFMVAYPNGSRKSPGWNNSGMGGIGESIKKTISNTKSRRRQAGENDQGYLCPRGWPNELGSGGRETDWVQAQSGLDRVLNGVPHRVDRLRCLGNAVVPQQVYPILAGIAQVEKEKINL